MAVAGGTSPVKQNGPVVPGNLPVFDGDGYLRDSGQAPSGGGGLPVNNPTFTGTLTGPTLVVSGNATMSGLPTADPHVVGRLWSNSGVLTVSAG